MGQDAQDSTRIAADGVSSVYFDLSSDKEIIVQITADAGILSNGQQTGSQVNVALKSAIASRVYLTSDNKVNDNVMVHVTFCEPQQEIALQYSFTKASCDSFTYNTLAVKPLKTSTGSDSTNLNSNITAVTYFDLSVDVLDEPVLVIGNGVNVGTTPTSSTTNMNVTLAKNVQTRIYVTGTVPNQNASVVIRRCSEDKIIYFQVSSPCVAFQGNNITTVLQQTIQGSDSTSIVADGTSTAWFNVDVSNVDETLTITTTNGTLSSSINQTGTNQLTVPITKGISTKVFIRSSTIPENDVLVRIAGCGHYQDLQYSFRQVSTNPPVLTPYMSISSATGNYSFSASPAIQFFNDTIYNLESEPLTPSGRLIEFKALPWGNDTLFRHISLNNSAYFQYNENNKLGTSNIQISNTLSLAGSFWLFGSWISNPTVKDSVLISYY